MTFEELIRKDLMDAFHAARPAIPLDASGEPNTCRCFITARDFDYSNPRSYRGPVNTVGTGDTPAMTMRVFKVTADMTITAGFEINAMTQQDLDCFLESLLKTHRLLWTWRGNSVRVDRRVKSTKLAVADTGTHLREMVYVTYEAPFFDTKDLPLIADASYFDGWEYGVA